MRPFAALIVVTLLLVVAACGGSSEHSQNLEGRIAKLEAQNAALQRERVAAAAKIAALSRDLRTLRENQDALYTGLLMTQEGVLCGFKESCHVPLGSPGRVFRDDSGKIVAVPYP